MPTPLSLAPLVRLPAERQILTYLSIEPVVPGALVRVPLGRSETEAIVIGQADVTETAGLKELSEILDPTAITTDQIDLARWIAGYYRSSLGQSLQLFVPRGLGKSRRVAVDEETQPPLPAPPRLTGEQEQALETIEAHPTTLIHGVTSSGKTELYMRAAATALESGGGAIILVPEIALTPQTFERFESRFPGRIVLWHSRLTEAKRIRTWQGIRSGRYPVVIGSRSALFTPVPRLRVIVIDEEHDGSYKQASGVRYHARTVAAELAQRVGARLILGSATPSVESYSRAQRGEIGLASLPTRVTGALPEVRIVDLRSELASGNASTISAPLAEALAQRLERAEQSVLFLNRRGAASSVLCRDCGEAVRCPNCSTALTYHATTRLVCHHCGHRTPVPQRCPACGSERIRYIGAGTQAVEADLTRRFPEARILRMDKDTTTRAHSHAEIFETFRAGSADILLGTQMVTKGWDIPAVTLVGVLLADLTLTLPDFHADEWSYQLLSQVAGRSGRGSEAGTVLIQTYQPEHPVLELVRAHDSSRFYTRELPLRESLGYPPYRALVTLTYAHADQARAASRMDELAETLTSLTSEGVDVIGPAPSFLSRLRGRYYYQLVLKAKNRTNLDPVLDAVPADISIDVDPEDLIS